MIVQRISEEQHDRRLAKPHDPPPEARSSEVEDEYYLLYSSLSELMETVGKNDPYGQGDYNLDPAVTDSRGLGFEVNNDEIVNNALIKSISIIIQKVAPRWEVYIGSSNFDWGVFVSTTETTFFKKSDTLLPYLHEE